VKALREGSEGVLWRALPAAPINYRQYCIIGALIKIKLA
jgi:hypothetical protein